jgi:quercetin dioxygenase-like cupin family protein
MTGAATDTFHLLGNLLRLRARTDGTGGVLSVVEVRTAPGAGAPPNRHPGEDEAFYVLSGHYEFVMNGEARRCGPGDFVRIPNGAVHSFRNVGEDVASSLIVIWPGRGHDAFFSEAGEPVPSGSTQFPEGLQPDLPRILAVAERCGIELLVDKSA